MRRLIGFVFFATVVLAAAPPKAVPVAQFEQKLTATYAAHKPDAEIARQIGGVELSDRLTEEALVRLKKELNPGPESVVALQLLADSGRLLDP